MESKKILIITTMMVVIMLSLSTIVEAVNIGEKLSIYGKLGDVNRDGKINSTDTNMIIQYSAGSKYLTILQRKRADVNQDNKINSEDSFLLMKYISNNQPVVKPTRIEISGTTEVEVDKTIQLTAKVKPDNTTDKTVTWTSSNTSRATVDTNGNVRGIKEGTVRITAKCGDKSSYININVKAKPVINVTSLTLTGENQVEVGKTIQLTATVRPNNATDKTVTWNSSDTRIATVNNNGVVKGEKEGTVTITARCNGVSPQTLTITVKKSKVSLKDKPAVKVKEVDAKPANVKVNDNKTFWNVLYHGDDPHPEKVNMNSNGDYKCSGAIALYYANKILGMNPSTSLITTTYVNSKNKTETNFPGGGYLYNDRCLTYDNQINIIYDEILKGNPVPVKVKNSDGDAIYVLAYAVKIKAANNGKVLASDIAVIDTKTGSYGKCLDAYYQFSPDTFVVATRDPNYLSYTYTFGGITYKTAVTKAQIDAILKTIQDKKIYQEYGDALDGECARVATYYIYMINGKISNPSRSGAANFGWPTVYAIKYSASDVKSLVDNKILSRLHVRNSKYEHWSTVIGYTGNGTKFSDYLLLDPYRGTLLKGGTSTSEWLYNGRWEAKAYK